MQAHIKAVQAQHELQAATQSKQDAEGAEQRRLEVNSPSCTHHCADIPDAPDLPVSLCACVTKGSN